MSVNDPHFGEPEDNGAVGFQYTGRRELAAAERRIVRWRSLKSRLLFLGCMLAFPLVLFFALAAGVFIEEAQGIHRIGVILLTLFLFSLNIALVIVSRIFLGESRAVGRDAREGAVERYAGVLAPGDESCPPLGLLLRDGLLKAGTSEAQWFEVLPRSGFLWKVNGTQPRRLIPIATPRPTDPAEAPDYAATAAEWVEPVVEEGEALYVGQRELTPEEVRELKRHIRRFVSEPLKLAVPVTLWFGTVLALCLSSGSYPTGFNLVFFIALGVIAALSIFLLISRLLEARPYLADVRLGQVNIIRCSMAGEDAPPGRPELSEAVESLPHSGGTWTVGGQPALWRTEGGGWWRST